MASRDRFFYGAFSPCGILVGNVYAFVSEQEDVEVTSVVAFKNHIQHTFIPVVYISLGLFHQFNLMRMNKKHLPIEVILRYATGIDVGSRTHFVAVGQQSEDVGAFGVCNEDLREMIQWLREHEVSTLPWKVGVPIGKACFKINLRLESRSTHYKVARTIYPFHALDFLAMASYPYR